MKQAINIQGRQKWLLAVLFLLPLFLCCLLNKLCFIIPIVG